MARSLLLLAALLGLAALASATGTPDSDKKPWWDGLPDDKKACVSKCLDKKPREENKPKHHKGHKRHEHKPAPCDAPKPEEYKLKEWEQCGGAGGDCAEYGKGDLCKDAMFEKHTCPHGFECKRQHEYYYQCVKPDDGKHHDNKTYDAGMPDQPQGNKTYGDKPDKPHDSECKLKAWEQCGGAGGDCAKYGKGDLCKDAMFEKHTCPHGFECKRQHEYYYQCVKPDDGKHHDNKTYDDKPRHDDKPHGNMTYDDKPRHDDKPHGNMTYDDKPRHDDKPHGNMTYDKPRHDDKPHGR